MAMLDRMVAVGTPEVEDSTLAFLARKSRSEGADFRGALSSADQGWTDVVRRYADEHAAAESAAARRLLATRMRNLRSIGSTDEVHAAMTTLLTHTLVGPVTERLGRDLFDA